MHVIYQNVHWSIDNVIFIFYTLKHCNERLSVVEKHTRVPQNVSSVTCAILGMQSIKNMRRACNMLSSVFQNCTASNTEYVYITQRNFYKTTSVISLGFVFNFNFHALTLKVLQM